MKIGSPRKSGEITTTFNLSVGNYAEYGGHVVKYRSPMAESWVSAETFLRLEARNRNVHE
jgi:hypothetical protein